MRCLLLLLVVTAAHAQPVRDDIVDLRNGRSPSRRSSLGWTADNRFVVHVADCDFGDGRGPFCASSLEVTDERGTTEQTTLLDLGCNPCTRGDVPTALAMTAIRAERDALRLLGTLTPSPLASPPDVRVTSTSCRIEVRHGKRRAKLELGANCLHEGGNDAILDARLVAVATSPDGGTLAVTIGIEGSSGEFKNTQTKVFMLRN